MSTIADNVRKILGQMIKFEPMTVLELSDDPGRVTLDDGTGSPLNDIPCLASYTDREPGDQVEVLKLGSAWLVLGANAKPPGESATLDTATVQDMINQALPDVPPTVTVSKGSGPPSGSGWVQATDFPYWHDDGNGDRTIYLDTSESSGGGSTPPPPPSRKPKIVTITPNDHGSWRGNGQTSGNILQGNASEFGGGSSNWTGAIFYGTKISDACNGRSVDHMTVTVARTKSTGWNRRTPVHLGAHNNASKSNPGGLVDVYVAAQLAWGGSATVTLSNAIESSLASGSQKGLGITYTGSADYLQLTAGTGTIKIYFND